MGISNRLYVNKLLKLTMTAKIIANRSIYTPSDLESTRHEHAITCTQEFYIFATETVTRKDMLCYKELRNQKKLWKLHFNLPDIM